MFSKEPKITEDADFFGIRIVNFHCIILGLLNLFNKSEKFQTLTKLQQLARLKGLLYMQKNDHKTIQKLTDPKNRF